MKLYSTSSYNFAWKPTNTNDYSFRVHIPARTGYLAGYSPNRELVVS